MDAAILFHVISCFIAKSFAYIAESSSTYGDYVASRAVDGDTDQSGSRCSHTGVSWDITEAWLRIDLRRVYSVKSVKIWYRADRGSAEMNTIRLRGYSLRVSNDTTVPLPNSSCYTDPGNVVLPTVVEEDCERTAQYIWIYQSNTPGQPGDKCPMLEICEVKIFACNDGKYGVNCLSSCSGHCINGEACNKKDGSCRACEAGYEGRKCNKTCRAGIYGQNCSFPCGACLHSTPCNHINGSCEIGCEPGWQTETCRTACSDGRYGKNCQYTCSGHCVNGEACDKTNGSCRSCVHGYQGSKCDRGEACDKRNGSCKSCVHGYQGSKCDRDISQSPTSFKKRIGPEDLKMKKMMLENERIQKEILKLEAETEVLRVRKNVLLRLQGILSELSEVVVQLLNDS